MKLIRCSDVERNPDILTLYIPTSRDRPRYAILSHTWSEAGEITFQDLEHLGTARQQKSRAWGKIRNSCRLATTKGIEYLWVDTCCINKSSSAELSESINSMFQWYANAAICFAYLEDYTPDPDYPDHKQFSSDMASCRWFERGWTLQELIAPREVLFFDRHWVQVGTRSELHEDLASITRIGDDVLRGRGADTAIKRLLGTIPTCQRMCWAATRETTLVEDMAYCLLGIFDINMPLLYGEGGKAFKRLQEEIMRQSNDLSLFAWQTRAMPGFAEKQHDPDCYNNTFGLHSILACSPRLFWNAEDMKPKHASVASPELIATSKGIKILSYILPQTSEPCLFFLPLNCRDEGCSEEWGVLIRHLGGGVFARARSWTLVTDPRSRREKRDTFHLVEPIYLANLLPLEAMSTFPSLHHHAFRMTRLRVLEKTLKKAHWPPRYYDTMRHLWISHGLVSPTYCVSFYDGPVRSKLVMEPRREHLKLRAYFGCIDGRDPWVCLAGPQTAYGLLSYDNKLDDDLLARVGWRAAACQYQTARIVSEGKEFDIRAEIEEVMLDGEPIWQISFDVTYVPSLHG